MEAEGIAGEIIFPNTVPPFFRTSVLICGNPSVKDYPLWLEGIRAHNRWLVDFCAEAPERRAGIGLVYLNDIDEAIEDVQVDREGTGCAAACCCRTCRPTACTSRSSTRRRWSASMPCARTSAWC